MTTEPDNRDDLRLNADGSVTLLLLPEQAGDERPTLLLRPPSIAELPLIRLLFDEAQGKLPDLPELPTFADPDHPTPEETAAYKAASPAYIEVARQRGDIIYGEEQPHAHAFVQVLEMLSGKPVSPQAVPSGACNPQSLRKLLNHYQAPLGGPVLV